ncbi:MULTISPECIES: copper resistance CopC family protein [unclassified Micromonospora]|uniref:copper resistance CopC family protein n=1 Tax=unclassified Micromonospora TaxID=2617518 RepID=UPI003321E730
MPTRLRRPTATGLVAAALAAAALLLVPAAPAAAHNTLQSASPAKDARLTTAPTQVKLTFMQKLDPAFTTIALTDAAQTKVATGEPVVNGTTGTVTIDRPLANGTYTVAYRVVSADGHPVQGSYRFTVADPSASAGPQATAPSSAPPAVDPSTASASPAAANGSDGGPGATALVVAAGVLAAVVGGGAAMVWRRRRAGA